MCFALQNTICVLDDPLQRLSLKERMKKEGKEPMRKYLSGLSEESAEQRGSEKRKWLRRPGWTFTQYICYGIIAMLLTGTCYNPVSDLTRHIIRTVQPMITVKITVEDNNEPGSDIWMIDTGDKNDIFSLLCSGNKNGEWEYRDKETWEYSNDTLISYAHSYENDNLGSSISANIPQDMDLYVALWGHTGCTGITVSTENSETYLDLNDPNGAVHKIHPVSRNVVQIVVQVILYVALCIIIFAVLVLGTYYFQRNGLPAILKMELSKRAFFYGTVVLYVYALIQYFTGSIPNFLEFGDQTYYWGVLNPDGGWDPVVISQRTASFRGFLCNLFPTIAQGVGKILRCDPVPIYFIFTALSIAWLLFVIFPELYEFYSGKRARVYQTLLCTVVYLFFWNGTLTAVLVDMFGVTCFMSGVLATLRFFENPKWRYAAQIGFWWSCACNFRLAYQYGMIALAIALILRWALKKAQFIGWKNLAVGLAVVLLFASPVLIPQCQINVARGHFGFLPYDFGSAWFGRSLTEYSIDSSLSASYTGYPIVISDEQMFVIKSQVYDLDDNIAITEVLNAYLEKPLDTLTYLVKKCFNAFNVLTSDCYPLSMAWNSGKGLMFSLLNYFVLFSGLYACLFVDKCNKGEKILFAVFAVGLVLPQLITHVEWRYYISTYLLLYYFFSYHFAELLFDEKNRMGLKSERYIPLLTVNLIVLLVMNLSITL